MRTLLLPLLCAALYLPSAALAQEPTGLPAEEPPAENPEAREGLAPEVETVPTPQPAKETREEAPPSALEVKAPARQAPWSPFVDTRLTFVFADDNVLANPGETLEPSPGTQFRATGANNLFFENYDTKDSGFETVSHLTLYKKTPTFFEGLYGEAALVLRLEVNPDSRRGTTSIADSSSYVRLTYRPQGWNEAEGISFTGFPVTSDRFRLGYSYRLTWGGDNIFPQAGTSVPGMRLQLTRDRWYAWVGGKSTVLSEQVNVQSEQATELVANYGALTGLGFDLTPNLTVEAGAGLFTRGTFLRGEVLSALQGEKIYSGGGSLQVAWHVGRPVGTSIDLRLYRNDPELQQTLFRPETYGEEMAYVIKGEVTWLAQNLADPESAGSTSLQSARAADLNFAAKFGLNRVFLDAVYQDLAFILFNVPSFVPFQDFTGEMAPNPEMFFAVGYDRYVESLHLTPGVRLGVMRPAYVVTDRLPAGTNPPIELAGQRTVVVRSPFRRDVLPADAEVIPIFAVQGTARIDLAESLAMLGEVSLEVDNNRATFTNLATGERVSIFEDPFLLGFNLVVQARF